MPSEKALTWALAPKSHRDPLQHLSAGHRGGHEPGNPLANGQVLLRRHRGSGQWQLGPTGPELPRTSPCPGSPELPPTTSITLCMTSKGSPLPAEGSGLNRMPFLAFFLAGPWTDPSPDPHLMLGSGLTHSALIPCASLYQQLWLHLQTLHQPS